VYARKAVGISRSAGKQYTEKNKKASRKRGAGKAEGKAHRKCTK
jgi:hypothetical protein